MSEQAWRVFIKRHALTDAQTEQFQRYMHLLLTWNEKKNLTAITSVPAILEDHFADSLALGSATTLRSGMTICDVGAGGGFPGLPLKIKYPEIKLVLIEVNQKKVAFLREVIQDLGLTDCTVYDCDWRTFIRQAPQPVDIFCARASLQPEELARMFKPSSAYKDKKLVYWASRHWELPQNLKKFFKREREYFVNSKKRRLVFFTFSVACPIT